MSNWSREENEFTVAQYFQLLNEELANQEPTKVAFNRRVQEATGRSRGSVEYKFQNISAVLHDLHAPWVEGYKPASNYQRDLADAVRDFIDRHPVSLDLMRQSVSDAAAPRVDLVWQVVDPPDDARLPNTSDQPPVALHTDFVALEAANRSLGLEGEKLVLRREREALARSGRSDLADRVEHVSVVRGDGLGYDIASFTPDGEPRLIEVKTTRRGAGWPMMVSRGEVARSRELRDDFVLARVFHFAKSTVGLYELPGAIEDTCILEPESYRAVPRPAAA